jgi:3-oxoadipate enol-lactonase
MLIKGMEVEVAGEGPAVILVHGLGGSSNVWQPQIGALAQGRKVYRPDLVGSGRSLARSAISVDGLVGDLIALLDQEKIREAAFVGHSFGSLILQHLAASHPQRVSKLALIGPIRAPAEAGRKGARDRAAKVRAEGMAPLADVILGVAIAPRTREHKPAVVALVREFLMRQNPEGYARTCEALADAVDADLSRIKAATLLVTGADDVISAPATAEMLQRDIGGASVEILPECGHWTPIEQPEAVTALLKKFL